MCIGFIEKSLYLDFITKFAILQGQSFNNRTMNVSSVKTKNKKLLSLSNTPKISA